jgi:soluble lytic murein transglycosylase-like protein
MKLAYEHMKAITPAPEPKDPVLRQALTDAAQNAGIDRDLLKAIAWVESRYDVKAVNPRTGASGWFQWMPKWAAALRFDPFNPVLSAHFAAQALKKNLQTFDGDASLAVAAYDWGARHVKEKTDPNLWPRETRDYLIAVFGGAGYPIPFPGRVEYLPPVRLSSGRLFSLPGRVCS